MCCLCQGVPGPSGPAGPKGEPGDAGAPGQVSAELEHRDEGSIPTEPCSLVPSLCAQAIAGPPGAKGEKVRSWGARWRDPHPWVLPKALGLGRAGVWYLMLAGLSTRVCLSTCVLLQGEPALLEGVLLGEPVSWPHHPPH